MKKRLFLMSLFFMLMGISLAQSTTLVIASIHETEVSVSPDPNGTTLKAALYAVINDDNRPRITKITIVNPGEGIEVACEADLSYLFSVEFNVLPVSYSALTEINGLEYVNTDNVTNMSYMFRECESLLSLDLSNFNTENVTNMGTMFGNCKSLKSLDLSSFNTENVTNMESMFWECSAPLNLSNFNTENVTNMRGMFSSYSSQSLNISNFDTKNVSDMSGMFSHCYRLISLDLSNFNTEKVTNMQYMFSSCSALQSLNISSFNTERVTNMEDMFNYCGSLHSLNLSNFNTANVSNIGGMFNSCTSLHSLNLSNFNTENVTNMSGIFSYCYLLDTLNIAHFNTNSCSTSSNVFYNTNLLRYVVISDNIHKNISNQITPRSGGEFATPGMWVSTNNNSESDSIPVNEADLSVGGTYYAKPATRTLVSATLVGTEVTIAPDPNGTTLKAALHATVNHNNRATITKIIIEDPGEGNFVAHEKDLSRLFSSPNPEDNIFYTTLSSIEGLEHISTLSVTNMNAMFYGCSALSTLEVSHFNTIDVTDMSQMFYGCSDLQSLDLYYFKTQNVTNMSQMFYGCSNLQSPYLYNFRTANVTNMSQMFYGCSNIQQLSLNPFNTENVETMNQMFAYCTNLSDLSINQFNTHNLDLSSSDITARGDYDILKDTKLDYVQIGEQLTENISNQILPREGGDYVTPGLWMRRDDWQISANIPVSGTPATSMYGTYLAKPYPAPFTLTFDPNGGNTSVESKTVYYYEPVGELPIPIYEGYTFISWTIATYEYTGDNVIITPTTVWEPEGGRTACAKWKANEYTLSFNANGGTDTPSSTTVTFNEAIGTLPAPTKTDYIFAGWYIDGTLVTEDTEYHYVENKTAVAGWSSIYGSLATATLNDTVVTISPDPFGTTFKTALNAVITDENRANITQIIIENPGEGIKIACEENLSYLFSNSLTSDDNSYFSALTFIKGAQYINTENVTNMEGMFYNCSSLKFLNLSNFNTEDVTNMGRMFSSCTSMLSLNITNFNTTNLIHSSDIFEATRLNYVVIGNHITENVANQILPKNGGEYLGTWIRLSDRHASEYIPVNETSSMAEAGRYIANMNTEPYLLTFDATLGYTPTENKVVNRFKSIGELPIPIYEGYTYTGWMIDEDLITETTLWRYDEDKTAVTHWTANDYTVTYTVSGEIPTGYTAPEQLTEKHIGDVITVADVPSAVEGYTFEGWKYNGNIVESFTMPAANIEITGVWSGNTYYVQFNKNAEDATNTMEKQKFTYSIEDNLAENLYEREAYGFKGWATSPTGDVVFQDQAPVLNLAISQNAIIDLYAVWGQEFTLTWDANSGTTDETSRTVVYEQAVGALPAKPVRTGFEFAGWFIGTEEITATTTWTYTDDMTAVAHYFRAEESKISCYQRNDGKITVTASPDVALPYTITLKNGSTTVTSITGNEREFAGLEPATYSVNVAENSMNVSVTEALPFAVSSLTAAPFQYGQSIVIAAYGPENCTWSPEEIITSAQGSNIVAVKLVQPTTTITVTGNDHGCIITQSLTFNVEDCPATASDVEENEYKVGAFAGQCWFRENLKATKYADENLIPFANVYEHPDIEFTTDFGRIYDRASALRIEGNTEINTNKLQGACPEGWRLPTAEELSQLSLQYTSNELRSQTLWIDGGGQCDAENGFNALPAGFYNSEFARYEMMYTFTGFWSSTITSTGVSYGQLSCYCGEFEIENASTNTNMGLSIRCVKTIDATVATLPAEVNGTNAILYSYESANDQTIASRAFQYRKIGDSNWTTINGTQSEDNARIASAQAFDLASGAYEYKAIITAQGSDVTVEGNVQSFVVE